MSKAVSVKRELRFQQWVQQVKEYNERPEGMSMSAWCKQNGVAPSTFATRLQKVQDRCLDMALIPNPSGQSSNAVVESSPTSFVEVPSSFAGLTSFTAESMSQTVAVISCRNFRIEISEGVSEAFLIKMIGALNNA